MNEETKKEGAVAIRQRKEKEVILEQLRRFPVIQIACEKASVSRATFYRLRAEDTEFKTSIDEAMAEGVAFINDMSETQEISLIKEKYWPAINAWLRSHHPTYASRLEINGRVEHTNETLTPEKEAMVKKALELGGFNGHEEK